MKKKVVIWDLDDTIVPFLPKLLDVYNARYNDNLQLSDITEWDMSKFVKPECGQKIYDIFKGPYFFSELGIIEGAKKAVMLLNHTMKTYFCSYASGNANVVAGKYIWIEREFPSLGVDRLWVGKDKGLMNGDYMIDDGPHNLDAFQATNPTAVCILMDKPHNHRETKYLRAKNPMQATEIILDIEDGRLGRIVHEFFDRYLADVGHDRIYVDKLNCSRIGDIEWIYIHNFRQLINMQRKLEEIESTPSKSPNQIQTMWERSIELGGNTV